MKKFLKITPFFFLLLLVIFVFGAFGSAPEEIKKVSVVLIGGWSLYAVIFFPRQWLVPKIPVFCLILVVAILIFGWLVTLNAKASYSFVDFSFKEIENRFWKQGPGTVTQKASIAKMWEVTALFLAFLAVVRSCESRWWKWVLGMFPVLGAAITCIGLYHRAIDASSVWLVDQIHPETFFAPYVYNANAGALLNFCGAIAFSFWISSLGQTILSRKVFWGLLTLLSFAGSVATASKGAFLVMLITVGLCGLAHRGRIFSTVTLGFKNLKSSKLESRVLAGTFLILVFLFFVVGLPSLLSRVTGLLEDLRAGDSATVNGRLGIMKVLLKMSYPNEGGYVGFGPGSFSIVVPYFLAKEEPVILGRWIHGHCDPLQLIAEWGYFGAAAWILFGSGALVRGVILLRRNVPSVSHRPLMRGAIVALTSLIVHSFFDFPFGLLSIKFAAMLAIGVLWGYKNSERDPDPKV